MLALDFSAGTLVPLFDRPLGRPMGHYVVWPKGRTVAYKQRVFLAWLEQETARA